MKTTILYLILLGTLLSCKPELEEFEPSPGDANFSHYVALGNSLTAGYADGALYTSGQLSSFTNILAQQFKLVGGGDFKIPIYPDENGIGVSTSGALSVNTKFILRYKTDCKGVSALTPIRAGTPDIGKLFTYIGNQGPFNNLGVPGAKSFHLLTPQLGGLTGNPYYGRFASNPGTSTVVGDALAQNPTFFTLWIGNNDALLYAVGGGNESGDSITGPVYFNSYLGSILTALQTSNAKGAIANIPNITSLPYFTTVPYNGLALTDPTQVADLNAAYNGTGITFQLGANPFVIKGAGGVPRQIKSNEYILLTVPQDSIKCFGWGSTVPIPANHVLDEQEIAAVQNAVAQYNTSIRSYATQFNLAFVDMNSLMANLNSGINFQGVELTTKFVTGGAFSLDGIHLTPIGNAVAANEFIRSINLKFNAQIPLVDATGYSGIKFP